MNARPEVFDGDQALSVNDRLKKSFTSVLWGSMVVATVVHFAVFALWPELQAPVLSVRPSGPVILTAPPDAPIPPQPDPFTRPARPEIASGPVDPNLTMSRTDFGSIDVKDLPDPPKGGQTDSVGGPRFTPYTVGPSILNRDEVVRAMEKAYPLMLREAGIGGTVTLYLYIDENGVVKDHRIEKSSGHPQLDSAAIEVADVYRFTPALNLDRKTAVWVQFPITFSVK